MDPEQLVISDDPKHPANTICSLCRDFYRKDWRLGTGGAVSIRDKEHNICYITPSGVQKELMSPTDMFVASVAGSSGDIEYLRRPGNLKASDCTPLFMTCYRELDDVGAIIHTHSENAVLASMLNDKVVEISHIEQLKALPSDKLDPKTGKYRNLLFQETLKIPIIENKNFEYELTDSLLEICREYPRGCAVLVRRHGIFVWGPTVEKAKIYNESIDYLLGIWLRLYQLGVPIMKKHAESS